MEWTDRTPGQSPDSIDLAAKARAAGVSIKRHLRQG
jgi:hypothetical protein